MPLPAAIQHELELHQAREIQRRQQQGLGHPIISTECHDHRIVAVGNRLHWSKNWKTFPDFLCDYIKMVLGPDWGDAELRKPFDERHPVLQWYDHVCKHQRETVKTPGKVHSGPITGAVAAYLGLAYNLYVIEHNVRLQQVLVVRLKDPARFHGACYETYVAAVFIKAGFDINFEDESDSSTSHCEFTATYKATGRKFSVEAKARQPAKEHANVGNQLVKALRKAANYERIVFIDLNVPNDLTPEGYPSFMDDVTQSLRSREESLEIGGEPAPSAYVVVTNHPVHGNLDRVGIARSVLIEGFKIRDFKREAEFPLPEALKARERHREVLALVESLKAHSEIPTTFDGDNPELAFDKLQIPRLEIGEKYAIPDENGEEVVGELVEAAVMEPERRAYGVYRLPDGKRVIVAAPLTNAELAAYRRHPDTFFGVYRQVPKNTENPLELYDFFYDVYRKTSREKLLEFLQGHPNAEKLQEKSQEELARIYCEGLTYAVMKRREDEGEACDVSEEGDGLNSGP